ncbi:CU044_5270 family protein [Allokutzneria sp. A3M-2-11 16]|uniref:CU044_5270 family protein n=1 Tax=Allokutzneria sp. A3M-2-11 16 TaxID=2962043 RepID=UPI0020B642C7|nr:CU044_5270 family protein [Allokutzneria sp. A3M-2-11 16]MCP3800174.1 CU044_5270 family protein [Allokutzneria sp. A3M-2-11 16]
MRDAELNRALDAGLDDLADVPEMTETAFQSGRDRLFAAMQATEDELTITQEAPAPSAPRPQSQHRPGRWLVAAAAVGVLTVGALVSQTVTFDGSSGEAHARAVETLNKAAELATANTDPKIAPGQFRYRATRTEGITTYQSGGASTGGVLQETWIPADERQVWMDRRANLGKEKWVPGLEGKGEPASSTPRQLLGEWRAPCGDFDYFAVGSRKSCDKGDWYNPTPEFLAALPKDPKQLYEKFVASFPGGDAAVVTSVGSLLNSGRVPADIRATIYRALALVPSLAVTADVANLDNRKGTALGVRQGAEFREIIIDPANGQYIGERSVMAETEYGLKPGTVRSYSAVKTAVVNGIGAVPTS